MSERTNIFFSSIPYNSAIYWFSKCVAGVIICIVIDAVFVEIPNLVKKKKSVCVGLAVFAYLAFWGLCIYPGNWYGDATMVLSMARTFEISWLQGMFATIWDCAWMMIIPFPIVLTLADLAIFSVSIAVFFDYIYDSKSTKLRKTLTYVLFVLLLCNPGTVYKIFYEHRSGVVAFLELFLFVQIICKQYIERKTSYRYICYLGFTLGILSAFRTETIVVTIAFSIVIVLSWKNTITRNVLFLVIVFSVTLTNWAYSKPYRTTYDMAYMYKPLPYYITNEDELRGKNIKNDIDAISKVIDINKMREADINYVNNWFWDGMFVGNFTQEEFDDMKKAFIDITINNPRIYLTVRSKCFISTMCMDPKSYDMFYLLKAHHDMKDANAEGLTELPLFSPINSKIRYKCLNWLIDPFARLRADSHLLYTISNTAILAIMGLVLAIFGAIIQKKYTDLVTILSFAGLAIISFLLAPEASQIYYLGIYYVGELCLIRCMLEIVDAYPKRKAYVVDT